MRFSWPWKRPRTVERAKCPACDGSVFARVLTAYNLGGSGRTVECDKVGEVARCCACGALSTVLSDGRVLAARPARSATAAERPAPAPRGARDGRGAGLDADLETLSLD